MQYSDSVLLQTLAQTDSTDGKEKWLMQGGPFVQLSQEENQKVKYKTSVPVACCCRHPAGARSSDSRRVRAWGAPGGPEGTSRATGKGQKGRNAREMCLLDTGREVADGFNERSFGVRGVLACAL